MNLRAAGIRRSLMRDRAISVTQLGREWAGALLMTPALPESLRAPARNASHKGNAVLVPRCAWAEARRPSFVRSQMRPVHEDPVPPVTKHIFGYAMEMETERQEVDPSFPSWRERAARDRPTMHRAIGYRSAEGAPPSVPARRAPAAGRALRISILRRVRKSGKAMGSYGKIMASMIFGSFSPRGPGCGTRPKV